MKRPPEQCANSLVELIEDLGYGREIQHGAQYAATGRVMKISWNGSHGFEASVQGTRPRPYRLTVGFDAPDDLPDNECTCSVMGDCKHVAAALLRIAGEAYLAGYDWAHRVEDYLPAAWRRSGLAKLPAVEGDVLGPLAGAARRHADEPATENDADADAPVRKAEAPAATGQPWWRDYLGAPTRAEGNRILLQAFKKHAFGGHMSWFTDALPPVLARADNPIEALERYHQQVNEAVRMFRRAPRYDDPALREFLAGDEARAIREELDRRLHEANFFAWLDAGPAPTGNATRASAQWLAYPNGTGVPYLCFQLLVSSRKLQRAPRQLHGIKQLADEARSGRRTLPDEENRLVQWLAQQSLVYPHDFTPEKGRNDHCPIHVQNATLWLTRWASHGLITWEDGTPLRFEPSPARLVLRAGDSDTLVWHVAFPAVGDTPAREVPVSHAVLLRDGSSSQFQDREAIEQQVNVLVRDGAVARLVDTAGMPGAVLDAVVALGGLSAQRLRDTGAGARLSRKLGLGQGADDLAVFHTVPVRPRVVIRLDEQRQVSLQVTAAAADGSVFQRLPSGEWALWPRADRVREEGPALDAMPAEAEPLPATPEAEPVAATAIAVAPRAADIEPLDAWLNTIIPPGADSTQDAHGGAVLSWKLTAPLYQDLLIRWGFRPRGVEYLGNKTLSEVITARRVPRFKLKVEASGMDWLSVSVQLEEEMQYLSAEEVSAALARTQERLVQVGGGRYYEREDLEEYQNKLEVLAQMGLELGSDAQRVHAIQLVDPAARKLLDEVQASAETLPDVAAMLKRFAEMAVQFKGVPAVTFDKRLREILRPYQQAGAEFLVWACRGFGGALLADDMGLGKTLQTLAAIAALRPKTAKDRLPSLVVCPASVAHNWQREAERFAPWLKTVVLERGVGRKNVLENAGGHDLIVVNYALARRDIATLRAQPWLCVVVDEAQAIKNPQSETAHAVKSLDARYRIALTGTPIENRLSDLWSIIDYAVPGYFGSLKQFESGARTRGAQITSKLLRARLRPLLLRRMKAEVAPELPPRVEERLDCTLMPAQRKTYLAELKRTRMLLDALPGEKATQGPGRIRILAALTRLRQICCDPALIGLPEDGAGKLEVLVELLGPLLESGHKVLIFSQFVKMLERIRPRVKELDVPIFVLTGATTKRQALVEAFEAAPAPAVFLISLKAGGTGLNLISASHVVLFDPWWNPAVEAQAIDRTHRIGQDKTVVAFRLVAEGTIEERILELQARKQDLVKNVLEAEAFNRSLTREDLDFLLHAGE